MSEDHKALIGLSDRELKLRAGDATHQHYKGGLYRLLGAARDADTGECIMRTMDAGRHRVSWDRNGPDATIRRAEPPTPLQEAGVRELIAALVGAVLGSFLVALLAARTVEKAQLQVTALSNQLIACETRPVSP